MSKKVMRLVNPQTNEMECSARGVTRGAMRAPSGRYRQGTWQRQNGCKLKPSEPKPTRIPIRPRLELQLRLPRPGEGRDLYTHRVLVSLYEQLERLMAYDWEASLIEPVVDAYARGLRWPWAARRARP